MEREITTKMGTVPMGTIMAFALNKGNIPAGWLLCDGTEIPSKYQEFITALGSGKTPNLVGRSLIGAGIARNDMQTNGKLPNFDESSHWSLLNTGGEYTHKLIEDEMPEHSHTINKGDFGTHSRSFKGDDDSDHPFKTQSSNVGGTDKSGKNTPHNNMAPYLAINYIIYTGC